MKIAIVGAGAMGSLYGARLTQAGEEVWLVDTWQEHIAAIKEEGLTVTSANGVETVPVKATMDPGEIGPVDLVMIFVKSHATHDAALTTAVLQGPDTLVMTLQNGLGNAEQIAAVVGAERVLVGTTAMGATLEGPGRVIDNGKGVTHIGNFAASVTKKLYEIAAVFSRSGLYTVVDANVESLRWSRLTVNAGLNALSAVTGLTNGQLAAYLETQELMNRAVAEAEAVARAHGASLPHANMQAQVLANAQATKDNKSSMLQDVLKKRPTEIDAINGAIVREGTALGVATPVNEVLTLLVKARERSYLQGE